RRELRSYALGDVRWQRYGRLLKVAATSLGGLFAFEHAPQSSHLVEALHAVQRTVPRRRHLALASELHTHAGPARGECGRDAEGERDQRCLGEVAVVEDLRAGHGHAEAAGHRSLSLRGIDEHL